MNNNSFGDQGSGLSIMIPTFNCALFLAKTLQSIMEQPPGTLERAQITVVDDCSTQEDPEAVVKALGRGRVAFHRHPRNLGLCENFNSCFDLAQREWIQILHGDDYMLPDAYREFSTCVEQFPGALAVFARSHIVTAEGDFHCESEPLGPAGRGRLSYDPAMWSRNPIYPAGVLLHRRVTHEVGLFDCSFSHVNDWNYWWRLARTGECVYSNACIAAYRVSAGGHSSSLIRSGRNVFEGLDQVERLIASLAEDEGSAGIAIEPLYQAVYGTAFAQCSKFAGEHEPFLANWRSFRRMPARMRWKQKGALAGLWWRHARELLRRKVGRPR